MQTDSCRFRWGRAGWPCFGTFGLAVLFLMFCAGQAADAQNLTTFAGTMQVGVSSGPQTVAVTDQVAGQVSAVEVLTLGQPNLDFASAGGDTCSGANLTTHGACHIAVTFTPKYPGARYGAIVLLDSSKNVLATQYLLGTGQGALGVMVPGTIQTAVGSGEWTAVNDGQPAAQADLYLPAGEVVDGAGDIFIADSAHNRIREVYASGPNKGLIETICNTDGQPNYTGDGGAATDATLSNPQGIAIDGAGNLYIADTGNNAIREINASTGIITSVVNHQQTTTAGFSGDGGLATAALLDTPFGVTVDAAGNIYVADSKNQRIREVSIATGIINTIAGKGDLASPGVGEFSGDNGPALQADLNLPYAVAFDTAGNMYIPDSGNNRIRIVYAAGALAGTITTFAGNGSPAFAGDNGAAIDASFYSPEGLAIDAAGNLYVADNQNDRVRKISTSSGQITTIAGNGTGKYGGDDASATAAGLYGPQGLFLDGMGNLYIADYFDHRIREIQGNLALLTFTPAIREDQVSSPQTQAIENDGNASLTFATITPDANAAIDAASTTCAISTPLAVDATCNVGAEFAPTQVGNPVVGNIDLTGNPANSPLDIEVSGEADATTSTTTTLNATPNPALFGALVTLSASVATGTGTPTGTVTFMDGSTALGSSTLSSSGTTGTATFPISTLAVGAHQLTAVYAGDGVHGTSTSAVFTENIQETTSVALISSENPSVSGDSVIFTATVTAAASGGSAPTGSVVFKDGTTVLGSVGLTGNIATFTTSALPPGTHSITANYGGDAENASSTSAPLSQLVKATTSVSVSGVANPAFFGSSVTFTATVQGNGGTPTGTVSFTADGTSIGSRTLAGGSASVSTSSLAVGAHAIVATYSGDSNDAGSTITYTETVQKAASTTAITAAPNPSASGQAVSFSVTVKGGMTTPTGSVTLEDNGTPVTTSPLLANGTVAFSITTLAVGTHTITAVYSGDGNYGISSAAVSQKVQPNTQAVVTSSLNPSIYGQNVTLTVTVTGVSVTPTGSVTLKDGSSTLTVLTLGGGSASYTTSKLAVGQHAITAVYAGDSNNAGTTSPVITQTVNQASTTTAVSTNLNPVTAGKQVILSATVTGNVVTPTGSVKFYNQGNLLGTANLNGSGTATYSLSTSTLTVGSNSISAVYSGDSNDLSSTSAPYVLSVTQATSSVSLVSSRNPSVVLTTVVFTATVTGSGGTPTGQIVFKADGNSVATVNLTGGVATYSTSSLAVGQHTVTAAYLGDADNAAASANLTQTVQQAKPAIGVSSSLNPSTVGAGVAFTATASGFAGTPTGTVTFQDGGALLGTVNIAANGKATFSTAALALGQHDITVSYSGDGNNTAATSAALTQTVQETTTSSLTSSRNPSIGGTPVTFTATVLGASHGAVTGTVTFRNGGVSFGAAQVNGSGVATYTTSSLPVGADSITAVYGGDTLDAGSTSAALTQTVQSAGTTTVLASSANPSLLGANVTFTVTVSGTGATPTGTITFKDGTGVLATSNVSAAGVATYSTSSLAVGVHPITAVYSGDQDDQASSSAVLNQDVRAQTATTLTSSSNPVLAASPVTFTASVTNGNGAPPTGTVTLKDGANVLAQLTLPVGGRVTFVTSSLAVGQHSLTAVYSGDTDDAASTSSALTQTIQAIPTKTTLGASASSVNTDQQVGLVASVFSDGSVPITGTVTFQNGSTVLGSSPLNATGTASISPTLSAGTYNIVAIYSGDALNAGSTSVPVTVTVTTATNFNMSLSPTSVTVATKQYDTVTLTLTSTDGFADQLGLGCASLPASVTCAFSKDTVNLAANSTTTVQLTVDTSSPLTSGGSAKNVMPGGPSPTVVAAWVFPGSIVFGLVWWRSRKRYSGLFSLALLILLSGVGFAITGCGGLTIGGAQPGTYTFQVTATGAKTGMTHAINMTLTVNQ